MAPSEQGFCNCKNWNFYFLQTSMSEIFHLAHVSEAKLVALFIITFYNMLKIYYIWKIQSRKNLQKQFSKQYHWGTLPRVSLFITFPYSTTILTNLLNFFGRLILIWCLWNKPSKLILNCDGDFKIKRMIKFVTCIKKTKKPIQFSIGSCIFWSAVTLYVTCFTETNHFIRTIACWKLLPMTLHGYKGCEKSPVTILYSVHVVPLNTAPHPGWGLLQLLLIS